ncbi:MAG: efflux RND transporter periplasmic adaptor subunit [Desulfomonilia bacterium]|jgi:multidrug efflux system membrane fusion protein
MKRIMFCCVLLLCTTAIFIHGCSSKKKQTAVRPVPVVVAVAVQKTIPVQINAIGSVEAFQAISVRSQITGLITRVLFHEGQDVKKGDLLLEIDCRPNVEALKQAEANLVRDRAQTKYADQEVKRYADLVNKDYVAKEQYEQIQANFAALEATVKADEAFVRNNKLQVQYCSIYSPIDGRTGKLEVDQGNILKANDIEVATINQIQPIQVAFAIPEKDLPRVKKYFAQRKLEVDTLIPGEEGQEKGELTFVDNAIDKTTGTITLKGTFANKGKKLLPGQFVNVVMTLTTEPNAILVPTQSVDQGQEGQYVYVINPDSKAEMRPVTIGQVMNGETVILKGVKAGERVVTDGQVRLIPGSVVSVKNSQ